MDALLPPSDESRPPTNSPRRHTVHETVLGLNGESDGDDISSSASSAGPPLQQLHKHMTWAPGRQTSTRRSHLMERQVAKKTDAHSQLSASDMTLQVTCSGGEANGPFIDMLKRASSIAATQRAKQAKVRRRRLSTLAPKSWQDFVQETKKALGVAAWRDKSTYFEAIEVLNAETIACCLLEYVTYFYKATKDTVGGGGRQLVNPAWSTPSPWSLAREHAKNIAKLNEQARSLAAEVQIYYLWHHVTKHKVQTEELMESGETLAEKLEWVSDFWSHYHKESMIWKPRAALPTTTVTETLRSASKDHCERGGPRAMRPSSAGGNPCRRFLHVNKENAGAWRDPREPWKTRPARSCGVGQIRLRKSNSAGSIKAAKTNTSPALSRTVSRALGIPEGPEKVEAAPIFSDPVQRQRPGATGIVQALRKARELRPTRLPGPTGLGNLASLEHDRLAAELPPVEKFHDDGRPMYTGQNWRPRWPASLADSKPRDNSPADTYLEVVKAKRLLPHGLQYTGGRSLKLEVKGRNLADEDVVALCSIVRKFGVESVNLEDHAFLSPGTIVTLLTAIKEAEVDVALTKLVLRDCVGTGSSVAVAALAGLLRSPRLASSSLRELGLSKVPIASHHQVSLCHAIRDHPNLEVVNLANTGLGLVESDAARKCVCEVFESQSLHTLDLSWNCFDEQIFTMLGASFAKNNRLKSLRLKNTSALGSNKTNTTITPIAFFLEQVSLQDSLTYLDISLNRMDFRAALVAEDAFGNCRKLEDLDISDNPLGVLGMRSIVRLLLSNDSGLMRFQCKECWVGDLANALTDFQVFSAISPWGHYHLHLERPYHRALLRMVYKACDRFKIKLEDAMAYANYSVPPWKHPERGPDGLRTLPMSGVLKLFVSAERVFDKALGDCTRMDAAGFLAHYFKTSAMEPGFRKVVPLFAQWETTKLIAEEQQTLLDALSREVVLPYVFVRQLCQDCSRGLSLDMVLASAIPCMTSGPRGRFLTALLPTKPGDIIQVLHSCRSYLRLNLDNPSGRYRLDLSNTSDYIVALRLALIDSWEGAIQRKRELPDISQRGNWSQIRNEMHNMLPIPAPTLAEWSIPESGILMFDYSSSMRPPSNAVMLDDDTFTDLICALEQNESFVRRQDNEQAFAHSQLLALRSTSHLFYVSSMQMRSLLGIWHGEEARGECTVMFFDRVADIHNEKVFRVRVANQIELTRLRSRLGFIKSFPFIQPEQASFTLNFRHYDERLVATVLVALQRNESMNNLRKPSLTRGDGTADPLTMGVPRSWEKVEGVPHDGLFEVTYVCSPDDRNFNTRKQLLDRYYGAYTKTPPESQVRWWGAVSETPEAVLEYLFFLKEKYRDLRKAFVDIDGPGGNGVLSLREFEDAIIEMKCHKFKGPDEKKTVENIFRYLDPSGEGTISMKEWLVLELIWKEVELSVQEFVGFCVRTFGQNLITTWKALDKDNSGSIDMDEWVDALEEVGYFGPAMPVFFFLDADDDLQVSFDEFQELRAFTKA
eukprot:TRINITY_DN2233_c0_g3_i1.p1 TRINITY_DN2233_c0_g3~~TRINITY_DN2233_c0_g3_i1.p1  ORF type:complete len:1506 (-),score=258.98 TRINITY_DN2233_c0_g3_i1:434-4951(-)